MRSISHLTPRYVAYRVKEIIYQRTFPDHPWLTRTANQILASLLRSGDVGLEFGSGRSTLWFAKRVRHLTSVEHNLRWYQDITGKLKEANLHNVDYLLKPAREQEGQAMDAPYVMVMDGFSPNSIDFVLVDGVYRSYCALRSIPILRPGGFLIIDNVNWFLPSSSVSPNSRPIGDVAPEGVWREVHQALSDWRVIWTSSGVFDTALFFKPC
jgi:predicted O-methyltransferase YrrM